MGTLQRILRATGRFLRDNVIGVLKAVVISFSVLVGYVVDWWLEAVRGRAGASRILFLILSIIVLALLCGIPLAMIAPEALPGTGGDGERAVNPTPLPAATPQPTYTPLPTYTRPAEGSAPAGSGSAKAGGMGAVEAVWRGWTSG